MTHRWLAMLACLLRKPAPKMPKHDAARTVRGRSPAAPKGAKP